LEKVQQIHSFLLLAYVILLDNFYWLMRVDDAAGNFSTVLHSVKRNYTLNYKKTHGIGTALRLWQGRFWDHVIRDEHDLQRHFDYIRWNPVRHGYVTGPENWTQSTFLHWAERGYYAPEWGHGGEITSIDGMEFE